MCSLHSPFILRHYSTIEKEDGFAMLLEACQRGDLLELFCSHYEDRFNEEIAKFYAANMVLAVEALHASGFLHRDIKLDNFLVSDE